MTVATGELYMRADVTGFDAARIPRPGKESIDSSDAGFETTHERCCARHWLTGR